MNTNIKENKMNGLNSVLLEGNLIKDPVESRSKSDEIKCTLTVASERNYKIGDESIKDVTTIDVRMNLILAESCLKHLLKGRGVRIVGRLMQVVDNEDPEKSQIIIQAEHVEFKPVVVPGLENLEEAI